MSAVLLSENDIHSALGNGLAIEYTVHYLDNKYQHLLIHFKDYLIIVRM